MLDRIGTFFGFMVGAALIVFGITWPDHLSNYYIYQITGFEETLNQMRASGATLNAIAGVQTQLSEFKSSWEAGATR